MRITQSIAISKSLLIVVILYFSNASYSQNYYDTKHSILFAKYLERTNQLEFALQEYERVVFLMPSDTVKGDLLYLFGKLGYYDKGISRAKQLFSLNELSGYPANVYSYLVLQSHSAPELDTLLTVCKKIPSEYRTCIQIHSLLVNRKLRAASAMMDTCQSRSSVYLKYQSMLYDMKNVHTKNGFVAGALSTIVPGLGKVYTGYWKDGALAFLSVGTAGWQAYNGFNRDGINSVYGWLFGSIATIFYTGTIYGSVKSAKRKNNERYEKVLVDLDAIIPYP